MKRDKKKRNIHKSEKIRQEEGGGRETKHIRQSCTHDLKRCAKRETENRQKGEVIKREEASLGERDGATQFGGSWKSEKRNKKYI